MRGACACNATTTHDTNLGLGLGLDLAPRFELLSLERAVNRLFDIVVVVLEDLVALLGREERQHVDQLADLCVIMRSRSGARVLEAIALLVVCSLARLLSFGGHGGGRGA